MLDRLALLLVVIGAINWGSVGLFQFDIVSWIFGGASSIISRIIFTPVSYTHLDVYKRQGYTYSYNADTSFFAASLTKAPYCMYLFDLATDGKCDLEQKITYTEKIGSDGTGKVKNSPFGTQFTVSQLIEYTLRYSDNAALRMLRGVYPASGFQ